MLCSTSKVVVHTAKVVMFSEELDLMVLRLCADTSSTNANPMTSAPLRPCGALPLSDEAIKSGDRVRVMSFALAEGSRLPSFLEFNGRVSNIDKKGRMTLDLTGFCGMSGSLVRNEKGW